MKQLQELAGIPSRATVRQILKGNGQVKATESLTHKLYELIRKGDLNDDGMVTSTDRLGIAADWRQESEAFDLNLTEEVDPQDLLGLIELWRFQSQFEEPASIPKF